MSSIKGFFRNRWTKFTIALLVYLSIFVIWTGNLWAIIGVPFIYDWYISKFFHRFVWNHHKAMKSSNKSYRVVTEWTEAILFAVVVATLVRIFFFEMYVIPTSSMEKSLLVGDYLCVSKVAYGPKMPNTPVAFPLVHHTMPMSTTKRSFSEIIKMPYNRLAGLGEVKYGDAVVFNFPAGDTVILENQAVTYYDVLRDYQVSYGHKEGRDMLFKQYNIISRPVDKRENYIKRAIGLPGDSLQIISGEVLINGAKFENIPGRQFIYFIQTNGTPLRAEMLSDMGVAKDDIMYNASLGAYTLPLTDENVEKLKSLSNVLDVVRYEATEPSYDVFPQDTIFKWNQDNYGPLWIPKKGATVKLDMKSIPLYRRIIEVYEGNKFEIRGEEIFINGNRADSYTFNMDYYFMMGDNRHNSADSRYWGFVPEDHVVGKASFIWLSLNKDKGFPANIRWSRIFRMVK